MVIICIHTPVKACTASVIVSKILIFKQNRGVNIEECAELSNGKSSL